MTDLRDPSESKRTGRGVTEKRGGEGEYERQHREHKTRQGDTKGYNVDNRGGSGRESLTAFDQSVNVFSKKCIRSQMSFNTSKRK